MSAEASRRIDEYKCLRAEIVQFQTAENQWLLGLVTASGAVIGISLARDAVVPMLIVPLLAFATLERLKSIRYYIFRTAAWITVFVDEPGGLRETRWESDLQAYRMRDPKVATSPAGKSTGALITAVLASCVFAASWVAIDSVFSSNSAPFTSGTRSTALADVVASVGVLIAAICVYIPLRRFGDRSTSIAQAASFCEFWRSRRGDQSIQP